MIALQECGSHSDGMPKVVDKRSVQRKGTDQVRLPAVALDRRDTVGQAFGVKNCCRACGQLA